MLSLRSSLACRTALVVQAGVSLLGTPALTRLPRYFPGTACGRLGQQVDYAQPRLIRFVVQNVFLRRLVHNHTTANGRLTCMSHASEISHRSLHWPYRVHASLLSIPDPCRLLNYTHDPGFASVTEVLLGHAADLRNTRTSQGAQKL